MVHRHIIIMFGLVFTCGLMLGLGLHLPQTTAQGGGGGGDKRMRNARSANIATNDDTDIAVDFEHKEQLRTLLSQSFSENLEQDAESSAIRRVNKPEESHLQRQRDFQSENWDSDYNYLEQLGSNDQIEITNKQQFNYHSNKHEFNNDKLDATQQAARTKSGSKLRHTIESLPQQKVKKKAGIAIDMPPYPSKQSHDNKGLQPVAVKQHNPTQHVSADTGTKPRDDQFNHLWETVDGIYWSPQLEHLTPVGFSDTQASQWRHKIERGKITHLIEGCGRMQNRLVVFDDGSQMCARYRINNDQIQGEVYSYYLAQVLGINNVPPAILDRPDASKSRWEKAEKNIDSAKWNPRKLLVLTPYVRDLRTVYIPEELRNDERAIAPDTPTLVNKTVDELAELVQWSDLIILDYLTANVDRVVNNMFNLQWSPGMMSAPTHNLERSGEAGPLIFMDNESGLLHSYRLLDKYSHYHDKMLRAMCIFRKSTADTVKRYHKTGHLAAHMKDLLQRNEPLADKLASLPQNNIQTLNQRLAAVYRQILHCEHKYKHR